VELRSLRVPREDVAIGRGPSVIQNVGRLAHYAAVIHMEPRDNLFFVAGVAVGVLAVLLGIVVLAAT
jgi:hypothetical protein